jgi:hypothetical protein
MRKALKAVSQVRDGRVGSDRRGSPRFPYSVGSAVLVDGAGYPTRKWGVIFFGFRGDLARRSSIQDDNVACIRDHLQERIITIIS